MGAEPLIQRTKPVFSSANMSRFGVKLPFRSYRWADMQKYDLPRLASAPVGFLLNPETQDQCPLFSKLPTELRLIIFEYVLADYETTDFQLGSYAYPGNRYLPYVLDFIPRRKTDVKLLRTCQRIYQEVWTMPFVLAEHAFFFKDSFLQIADRITTNQTLNYGLALGEGLINRERFYSYRSHVEWYRGQHDDEFRVPSIRRIRYYIGDITQQQLINLMQHSIQSTWWYPRCVAISLNSKQNWVGRLNNTQEFKSQWVNAVRFPKSIQSIELDIGKFTNQGQVDKLISLLAEKWFFRRDDGVVFKVDETKTRFRYWKLSEKILEKCHLHVRSLQDRYYSFTPEQCELLCYIIPTVVWKPVTGFDPFAGGYNCPNIQLPPMTDIKVEDCIMQ